MLTPEKVKLLEKKLELLNALAGTELAKKMMQAKQVPLKPVKSTHKAR